MKTPARPGLASGDVMGKAWHWVAIAALFGSLGAAAGGLALPESDVGLPPPGPLVVGREEIDAESPAGDEARRIARLFGQEKVTLRAGRFERALPRERLGLRLDQAEATRLIEAWRDPTSPLRRYRRMAGKRGATAVPVPVKVDVDAAMRALLGMKEELDVAAADAHVDLDAKRIVPETIGRRLDVYSSLWRIHRAARSMSDDVELAAIRVEPSVKRASLSSVAFDDVLGWFETPYSRQTKYRDRTYNLELAAKSLHGQVLMPGELFSFNDVVGERSEARGYRVATVIAAGELVDGMGGGTCQIAGTLHAAAFFAGLEVVEREPHSRPSSYIRVGLDATVSYPNIDLKLRNPFPFPVVIGLTVREGKVRGEILGPERTLKITYLRTILDSRDPPSRTIEDDSLPLGQKVVTQAGVPGFKVRRFRIFEQGTRLWREESVDRYPPVVHIVRVGKNPSLRPAEDGSDGASGGASFPTPCNMRIVQGPEGLFEEQTACR